ncbi:hypothetical protein Ancab_002317 [Ancistrocladus abbreviatus]
MAIGFAATSCKDKGRSRKRGKQEEGDKGWVEVKDPAVQHSSTAATAAARPSTAAASSHSSVVSNLHSPADQHSSSFEGGCSTEICSS